MAIKIIILVRMERGFSVEKGSHCFPSLKGPQMDVSLAQLHLVELTEPDSFHHLGSILLRLGFSLAETERQLNLFEPDLMLFFMISL